MSRRRFRLKRKPRNPLERLLLLRSASIGLMLAARRAGSALATSAAASSVVIATAYARASVGSRPNRNRPARFDNDHAARPPTTSPATTSPPAWPTTPATMRDRVAPSAMRMPISLVCCDTRYAMHAEEADGRDRQAEDAEEAEHQHVQPTLGGLRGHEVVQTRDLAQRLLRQHLRDDTAERRQRIVRIAARMQEDEAVGLAASLRHWQVDLGTRADLEARLPRRWPRHPRRDARRRRRPTTTVRPSGSSPPKNMRAAASLRMTTASAPSRSSSVKYRPLLRGIASVRW